MLQNWKFCQQLDCPDRKVSVPFLQNRFFARQWLRSCKEDAVKMLTMRSLLSQKGIHGDVSRMSDEMIIDQVGELLASGDLHIHDRPAATPTPLRFGESGSAASSPPVPPSPSIASRLGDLRVTVRDAQTGKPILGAKVEIVGPSPSSNNITDAKGEVVKSAINSGSYIATATNTKYVAGWGSAIVSPNATADIEIKLTVITVTITFPEFPALDPRQPVVACPGHLLDITAKGTPTGGKFTWSISAPDHTQPLGTTDLVDHAGARLRTGPTVYLRGFMPDTTTGNIPAQSVEVNVVYTYTNGEEVPAKTNVTIHKIDFLVTNDTINARMIMPNETNLITSRPHKLKPGESPAHKHEFKPGVELGQRDGHAEMVTDPDIEIQLDASCPRKWDCAKNHRVGWLQTLDTSDRQIRYRDILETWKLNPPAPIRDGVPKTTPPTSIPTNFNVDPKLFPFYDTVHPFTDDRTKKTAHHEDSPTLAAYLVWEADPNALDPPPKVKQPQPLRLMSIHDTYLAWLVVQNTEWSLHDMDNSFTFLRNFKWSVDLDIKVDITEPAKSRCTPKEGQPIKAPAHPEMGKGKLNPNLKDPDAAHAFFLVTKAATPPV